MQKNLIKLKKKSNFILESKSHNISVLEYLEKRKTISKQSKYDLFKDMKFYQIYEEYLRSREFEIDIKNLIKKYDYKYIKKYIKLDLNLNNFFYL